MSDSSSPTTPLWEAVAALVWKEIVAELRSRGMLTSMLLFTTSVLFVFYFALELDAKARANVSAGVLWSTLIFAGTLGLNRSMAMEKEQGGLDGLLLAPIDRSAIYFGKLLANWALMIVVAAFAMLLYAIFYNQSFWNLGLWAVFLLG
ncbi:MAG: cytochrome C biogenesis protein, partial [Chloroflexi bacterium]|nr:cytochrome C biogenesis protein [Chloroflexota bacterium]